MSGAASLDITEFAPRSVKSDGEFEDILGEDTPAVWTSHRPAKGGESGAMLAEIIERAAKLKAARTPREARNGQGCREAPLAGEGGPLPSRRRAGAGTIAEEKR